MPEDDPPPTLAYRTATPRRAPDDRSITLLVTGAACVGIGVVLLVPIVVVLWMMVTRPREDDNAGALLVMCAAMPGMLGVIATFVGVRAIVGGMRVRRSRSHL